MKRSGWKQKGGVYEHERKSDKEVEEESPMVRFIFSAKRQSNR